MDFLISLRAERLGQGDGRVYTATYRATDDSGNASSASTGVDVPHDLGSVVEPMNLAVNGQQNTVVNWGAVSGAVHYDVVRGDLANLRINGSNVDLGQVVCIERDSLDTSSSSDSVQPAPGQTFFYAVQFFYGVQESSYGSESVGRARVIAPGNGNCP